MNFLLANILLGLAWALASGRFSLANFCLGFVLGYFFLWLTRRDPTATRYFHRVPQILQFIVIYVWDLIRANLRVAHDVITPRHHMRPGVIGIPLDVQSDAEITMLANLLTLTPGSLALDVSPDRKILYIHAMYIDEGNVEKLRREIKTNLEKRVLQVLR
jgi:multicomponent Na+:H+ antiporter subunit E